MNYLTGVFNSKFNEIAQLLNLKDSSGKVNTDYLKEISNEASRYGLIDEKTA